MRADVQTECLFTTCLLFFGLRSLCSGYHVHLLFPFTQQILFVVCLHWIVVQSDCSFVSFLACLSRVIRRYKVSWLSVAVVVFFLYYHSILLSSTPK